MSLILEALKKLERDKHTHDRGFLVLAASSAGTAGGSWTRGAALAAGAALGGAALTAVLLGGQRRWGRAEPPSATTAPAPVTLAAAITPAAPARPTAEPRVAWP
ncbi:MAG TPA: hypothetical protein VIG50_10610, partial [Vicinamibacteria bacterium]